jgi:aromatic ring-opening dioxygenase catalytic subunit (LigB family)
MSLVGDETRTIRRRAVLGGALGAAAVAASAGCRSERPSTSKEPVSMTTKRMPTLYLPHGGGPCFFMDWKMGPPDTWDRMKAWLASIGGSLPEPPQALLVISAHWEESVPTLITAPKHELLFDYYGFPKHTYELSWPAPVAPSVATRVQSLLSGAGMQVATNSDRGLDHGVFVPLKVAYPEAGTPTVQLSLVKGLDPAAHLALGRALAPLRDEGVFIVGSGMSYHNMRGFGRSDAYRQSLQFDAWLDETVAQPAAQRAERLTAWEKAPVARACHPREEHLLPLMVVAGAGGADAGRTVFKDKVMGVQVAAHQFG